MSILVPAWNPLNLTETVPSILRTENSCHKNYLDLCLILNQIALIWACHVTNERRRERERTESIITGLNTYRNTTVGFRRMTLGRSVSLILQIEESELLELMNFIFDLSLYILLYLAKEKKIIKFWSSSKLMLCSVFGKINRNFIKLYKN